MESRRFRKDVLSFRLHRKQLFLPFLSMKRPVTIDIPRKNGFLFTLSVPPAYPPALYFGRPLSSAPFSGLIQNRRVRFSCARREKKAPVWHLWDFECEAQLLPEWKEVLSRILEAIEETALRNNSRISGTLPPPPLSGPIPIRRSQIRFFLY